MFATSVEKPYDLIVARLSGLMTALEASEYFTELRRQFIAHRLPTYAMMIDVSDCPIQLQDMICSMGQYMATMRKARALATGSSLARLRIRRLFAQPYARITATAD